MKTNPKFLNRVATLMVCQPGDEKKFEQMCEEQIFSEKEWHKMFNEFRTTIPHLIFDTYNKVCLAMAYRAMKISGLQMSWNFHMDAETCILLRKHQTAMAVLKEVRGKLELLCKQVVMKELRAMYLDLHCHSDITYQVQYDPKLVSALELIRARIGF